ncbi:hypothetical protein AcW2_005128 [Taiwanofungus camphoratus]|nr:hypothetical protein AcW2_005128 [Antrodia cinnamomea]
MPSTSPRLPPELCDYILDYLWDCPSALAACGLACRAWLATTRLHLFRSVDLSRAEEYPRMERLLRISPNIIEYVRRVTISDPSIYGDQILPRILKANHLTIHSCAIFQMPLQIKRSLHTLLATVRSLTLRSVIFGRQMFPLLFSLFPRVSTLGLERVAWMNVPDLSLPLSPDLIAFSQASRVAIEDLQIWNSQEELVVWLLGGSVDLHLRRLDTTDELNILSDLLSTAGASLEHLGLTFSQGLGSEGVAKVACNTRLVSLHLRDRGLSATDLTCWQRMTAVLAYVRSVHLRRLQIEFHIHYVGDLAHVDWQLMDEQLARLTRECPQLVVTIKASNFLYESALVFAHEVKAAIANRLPKLRANESRLQVMCSRFLTAPA